MPNEPAAHPEEPAAGAGNVPSLRDWHPDVDVPPGLTLTDLANAAGLIGAWANEPGEDWAGIRVAARVYLDLSAAAEARRRDPGDCSESTSMIIVSSDGIVRPV